MSYDVFGSGVSVKAKIDGEYITIGCASNVSFRFSNEIIGKTDVNAGLFRKKRVRISDCDGSVNGVVMTNNTATKLTVFTFLQEAIRRSEVDLEFVFEDMSGNVKVVQGLFLVSSIGLQADINAFAEFDLEFTGTGGISITEVDPAPELLCDTMYSDWWITTDGETGISGTGHNGLSFAGHTVLEVDREGMQYDIITSGTPGNRQAKYTGGSNITFDPTVPFFAGETVFVIWIDDAS